MELRTQREWWTAGGVKEFLFCLLWLSNDHDNDNDNDNDNDIVFAARVSRDTYAD